MKSLRPVFLIPLCICILPSIALATSKEVLVGITNGEPQGMITITVISHGCTKKSDFTWSYDSRTLTFFRNIPDACKKLPFPIKLSFSTKELKIGSDDKYSLGNALSAKPNIRPFEKRTFSGSSTNGIQEALNNAIQSATNALPPDSYVDWKITNVTGHYGGFAGVHTTYVTIEATMFSLH